MQFRQESSSASTALLRWSLVLGLHAGLLWWGAGLLALIPLAISTVTDTGCKW